MAVLEHCPSTGRPCGFGSDCGGLGYCKRTGTHRLELGGDAGEVDRLRAENERLRLIADTQGAEVDRLRDELSTRSGQLREAVEERDEAIRLLANATDPENEGDWLEAREVGWEWARNRAS